MFLGIRLRITLFIFLCFLSFFLITIFILRPNALCFSVYQDWVLCFTYRICRSSTISILIHVETFKNVPPIWNCWIIIHLIQFPTNSKGILPFLGIVSVFVPYWKYDCLLSCYEPHKTIFQIYLNLFLHSWQHTPYTFTCPIFQDGVTLRNIWSRNSTEKKL